MPGSPVAIGRERWRDLSDVPATDRTDARCLGVIVGKRGIPPSKEGHDRGGLGARETTVSGRVPAGETSGLLDDLVT